MKRSLTLVCLLASAAGVGSVASSSTAFAQTPSAPAPAAQSAAGLSAAPEFPANPKIAIIAFQQAVAATNEGQRNFAQLRVKFEPKQAALKAQSDEIDSLKKQLQDAGSTLSEPERDSRLRTIDEKTKSLQRSAEDAQNEASDCDERHVSAAGTEGIRGAGRLFEPEQVHHRARHQRAADTRIVGQSSRPTSPRQW